MLNGFARNSTNLALGTRDKASAVTPGWYGGFLRDLSVNPPPLITTATGPFTVSRGFWRDSTGALAAVDGASAVAPVRIVAGLQRDSNNCLLTSEKSPASELGGFMRDSSGYVTIEPA